MENTLSIDFAAQLLDVFAVDVVVVLHELVDVSFGAKLDDAVGYGLDENDNLVEVPSIKLPSGWIKGTVGAGDAFCSGVLYGAWKGMDLKSAIELGTASAVCSLSQPGATEGMRTEAEARELYASLR